MARVIRRKVGFTLIELLIVMFASSIIMGVMANIFVDSWKTHINQDARNRIQQKSRFSVDEASALVRQAIGVVNILTANSVTYTTDADTVILKYSAIDANSTPLAQTDYIILTVEQANPLLLQKVVAADPASTRASLPLTTNLNNELGEFVLTYYNAAGSELSLGGSLETTESIKISVTTERVVSGQTVTSTFEDTVHLRNNPINP